MTDCMGCAKFGQWISSCHLSISIFSFMMRYSSMAFLVIISHLVILNI